MKSTLRFIFNLARTLSLILVVVFVGFLFLLANDDTFWQELAEEISRRQQQENVSTYPEKAEVPSLAQLEANESYAANPQNADEQEDYAPEPEEEFAGTEEFGIMSVEEISVQDKIAKKVKISVPGGAAYLRPTQIMYVSNLKNPDTLQLVKTNEKIIPVTATLTEIEKIMKSSSEECFLRIKPAVINCNYVQQVLSRRGNYPGNSSKYKYFVIMEDDQEIPVSYEKSKELKEKLDELF